MTEVIPTKDQPRFCPPDQRIVEERRQLLQPMEVKIGTIPTWLRERLLAAESDGRLSGNSGSLLEEAGGAIAHWGTSVAFRKEDFVCEGFGFNGEGTKRAQAFADLLDLTWHVSANSWLYPGKSIRIVFIPRRTEI